MPTSLFREELASRGFKQGGVSCNFETWERKEFDGNVTTVVHVRNGFEPPVKKFPKFPVAQPDPAAPPTNLVKRIGPKLTRNFLALQTKDKLLAIAGQYKIEVPANATKDDIVTALLGPAPSSTPTAAPATPMVEEVKSEEPKTDE